MIKTKTFSLYDAFAFGIKHYFNNFLTFLIATGTLALSMLVLHLVFAGSFLSLGILEGTIISPLTHGSLFKVTSLSSSLALIYLLIYLFIFAYYEYHMIRFGLALHAGQSIHWKDFFSIDPTHFLKFVGARFLRDLKIVLGLFFFIVGSVYFWIKYYFAGFPLVENKAENIRRDAAQARELVSSVKWRVLLFAIPVALLYGLMDSLIIGALFVPIWYLAQVHVYKELSAFYVQEPVPTDPADHKEM